MSKKTTNRPNVTTNYSTQDELDADLRPNRKKVKRVPSDASYQAAENRTRRTGETSKSYPVRGVNDPE